METNGGISEVHKQGCVNGFGAVWFSDQAMTNTFCHADSCDEFHAMFDNWMHNAFHAKPKMKQFHSVELMNCIHMTPKQEKCVL